MNKSTTIYKLKKILSYKNLTEKNYEEAYKLLLSIKDSEPKTYYNYLGKFLLNEEKIEEAKNAFLTELSINPQSASGHYNLYKIAVKEENYQSAYDNLKFYKENMNKEVNLELPLNMIKLYLDINYYRYFKEEDYQVKSSDTLVVTKIEDQKALEIYNKVIYDFNRKDFITLKEDLIKFNEIINRKNIKIEVNTLIKITEDIIKKINYEKNKPSMLVDIKEILRNIDALYYKDLTLAREKLEMLKESKESKEYSLEIKYLENKIKEKQLYNNLSDKRKEYYNFYVESGRKACREKNYQEALVCYEAGQYATKHPIFNYYIGKIYFYKNRYKEAEEKLLQYIEDGGSKLSKAYLYLSYIYNAMGLFKDKIKANLNCSKLNKVYTIDSIKSDFELKKQVDDNINEFDFFEDNEKIRFNKELKRIKELYIQGNVKQADKLLTQLEKNTTDNKDKEKIKTLYRNKTLYKNKSKQQQMNFKM